MQNQFSPPTKPKQPRRTQGPDSFLEALRSLSSGTAGQIRDFGSEARNQLSGKFPQADQSQPFPQHPDFADPFTHTDRESKYRRQTFFERQKAATEKVVFRKEDREVKQQIQALQEEIKKMAVSTQNLAQEVQIAAATPVVNVGSGKYHTSFFEKLRIVIREIRKRIDQSASWLSAHNAKGKKQSYYWSQAGKSGTKYMLSQERYMSNSAG